MISGSWASGVQRLASAVATTRWFLPSACVTLALLPQAFKLTLPPHEQFSGFFPDDAFYYYKTALRSYEGGVIPSFDGVNATTGFHPLWMLVAIALAGLTRDPGAYLSLMLATNLLFVGLFSMVLWRGLRRSLGWVLATAVICTLNWSNSYATAIFTGLETPLSLLFAWLAIERTVRVDYDDAAGLRGLGAVAGLAFLARTDFVLCLPLLAGVLWVRHRGASAERHLVAGTVAALPFAALTLPYLAWNLWLTGMIQPISGAIKSSGLMGARLSAAKELAVYGDWALRNGLLGQLAPVIVVLAIGVPLSATSWRLRRRWSLLDDPRALLWCGFAAMVTLYYAVAYGRTGGDWHLAPLAVAWSIVVAHALADLSRLRWGAPVVAIAVLASLAAYSGDAMRHRAEYLETNYHFVAPVFYQHEVSRWMADHLPPSATVGVFDAGYIAYFAGCRVVNLDGLINGRELYDYYRDGRGVIRYVIDKRLDYLSNYYFGDPSPERSPIAPYLERVFQVGPREVNLEGRPVTVDWYVWRVHRERIPPGLVESGVFDGVPPLRSR